jgi:hypothetical protein
MGGAIENEKMVHALLLKMMSLISVTNRLIGDGHVGL